MKNTLTILGAMIIVSFMMLSCGQNNIKQKELELKDRELALKEKELALKEKGISGTESVVKKSVQDPKTPIKAASESNMSDIKSFFSLFKQAVRDNDMEELYKYYNGESPNYNTKIKFIAEYKFSNRVKKIILNTSLPEYWEGNKCYGISGNDGEEGTAMLFSIMFIKSKNGNWKWEMNYVD